MNAYTPTDWHALLTVGGACAALLALGLAARGGRLRVACWIVGPAAIAITHIALANERPGVRMLALIAVLFVWMKAVVTASHPAKMKAPLWLAWAQLWPGMRPLRPVREKASYRGMLAVGAMSMLLGVAFVAAAHVMWRVTGNLWIATAPLLIGLSMIVHFGFFNVVAAGWRKAGFDARPLFRAPWVSGSLREFWGRRWNIAYTEMMQESVQRPLRARPALATAAVFLFSGLLHEVAISLPVQAGYGLPTAYFALHGLAVLVERKFVSPGTAIARVWTALLVLAPLPILFHPAFLRGTIWPLGGIVG